MLHMKKSITLLSYFVRNTISGRKKKINIILNLKSYPSLRTWINEDFITKVS